MIRRIALGGLTVAVVLAGCSGDPGVTPPVIAAKAVAVSNGQHGFTSSELPHPLGVLVQADGRPAAGVRVTWSTSSGSVSPGSGVTGPDGVAEARWVLGATPGELSATAAIADGGILVAFRATATPVVTMAIDPATDDQSGAVDESLPMPIRVRVLSDGHPTAGTAVTWTVASGSIAPNPSITDVDGYAQATWRMGTAPGTASGSVKTGWAQFGASAAFTATARPGKPGSMVYVKGDGDVVRRLPANPALRDTFVVQIMDRFWNPTPGVEMSWVVEGSPITLVWAEASTDSLGLSRAVIAPAGGAGSGVLHMMVPDAYIYSDLFADYDILIEYRVRYDPSLGFISEQNGSMPAVDTIPLDATMHWTLDPDDQGDHTLQAWTAPSYLHLLPFPRAPEAISLSYPNPGSFGYSDIATALAGTVVVKCPPPSPEAPT